VHLRALYPESFEVTYASRTCDCRRSSRLTQHKPALNGPLQRQCDGELRAAATADRGPGWRVGYHGKWHRRALLLAVWQAAAFAAFARDPSLEIVGACHVEEFGKDRRAPADAIVEFQGDDPESGPLLRYTIVKPQDQQLRQRIGGRRGAAWQVLPPPVISSEAGSRVIRFRSRTGASHRSHLGNIPIGCSGPDQSPVPDLSKYECPESEDDYRHRMVINAIALVFVSLMSLAGFWLVNVIAHS